jgi:hypothetical protein
MNELAEKIKLIIEEVQRERGSFTFAALVQRADTETPWMYDFLVAAPWIGQKMDFYEYIHPKLSRDLRREDWEMFARVLVLDPSGKFTRQFVNNIGQLEGEREVQNLRIANIDIRYAHVFASQPEDSLAYANA